MSKFSFAETGDHKRVTSPPAEGTVGLGELALSRARLLERRLLRPRPVQADPDLAFGSESID